MFPSCTHREPSASFAASGVKTQAKKIRGNLESVGDRGVMLYYDETPRGRLFFYPWHTIERVENVRD